MAGILLDKNNDLQVLVRRDSNGLITQGLVIGKSKMQDVFVVLNLNQGDLKEDPIMGTNLLRNIRGKANREKIKKGIRIALQRAGIDFEEVKHEIAVMLNNNKVEL